MHKNTTTTYKIKADYNYYQGTYNAPQDGYIGVAKYSPQDGKDYLRHLEFESLLEAFDFLTQSFASVGGLACRYDGNGIFSQSGQYVCAYGQYSRPTYKIVGSKSGRCNRAIIAACDALNA